MIKLYCSHITRELLMFDERYEPLSSSIVSNLAQYGLQLTIVFLYWYTVPEIVCF